MNPPDEEAPKLVPTEGQSPGAVAGAHDDLEEQLHATLKDLQRTNHQSKPAEDLHGPDDKLDEQLRVSVEALLHPSPPPKPAVDLDDLLSGITHHLDDETSERKAIYSRLAAIENEIKRRGSGGLARYLLAICIGVVAAFAWQSYGEATKHSIATSAPELGWSPETKQMIASWMQQLGWAKPLAGPENTAVRSSVPDTRQAPPVAQTAPENVEPKAPAAPSLDPAQVQQIAQDVAALRQTVEQLAADQDQIARQITRLEAADIEILAKLPVPPPPRPVAAPARKPTQIAPPSPRAPIPPPHP